MSLTTIISELWRFFKDNFLRILIGSFVVAFLAVGGRYYISQYLFADKQDAANHLEHIYSQEPASFRAIVMIEDGQIFSNPHIYDDYFSSSEVVAEVEAQTGVAISDTLQSELTLELFKTPTYRGGIAGIRDSASWVFTFRFLVGADEKENLAVAEAYRDILMSASIPFATNHTIDIVAEPAIGEMIDTDTHQNIAQPQILNVYRSDNVPSLIVYGVLGFVIGILLMTGFVFILRLRKPKIAYAFEYAWDLNDQHIIVSTEGKETINSMKDAIQTPLLINRWIVSQSKLGDEVNEFNIADNETFIASLKDLTKESVNPQQIVIVVSTNHTDKTWYNDQLTLSRLYNVPVKVVHVY